ncbi:hypothetical protein Y032_0015g2865 [Ancylostoma ceylanicum]|uniref:SCP domain-containing protein n=1 Tax=Ancylostoma ceylanicum TaxID=53326 RepID=A0A016V857_9BILA|nr:hypothetical protein Y032_0015g2865 [Ancylostoma ceylanicum]
MVHWHVTFAIFYLVQVVFSEAVPSDPPQCSYEGKAFTDRNRKRIFDAVVGATDGLTLGYSCDLEEEALPLLKGGSVDPPLIMLRYEGDRTRHHNAGSFFKEAVQSWSEGLGRVYSCALEGFAGLILADPRKPCTDTSDIMQLPYERKVEPGVQTENVIEEAKKAWKQYFYSLNRVDRIGCNYIVEHNKHKFLCFFKRN